MDQENTSFSVKLYIYDLSKGMARQLSSVMLGKWWVRCGHSGFSKLFLLKLGCQHCEICCCKLTS